MPKPLIDEEGEVRELTLDDFRVLRPMGELHPDIPRRVRGPQKNPTKVPISIRLEPEVLDYFRATGQGWQARMGDVLKEYVAGHRMG